MTYKIEISENSYRAFIAGYKSAEICLYDIDCQKLKAGDTVLLTFRENNVEKTVRKITVYPDMTALYNNAQMLKCGYTPFTLRERSPHDAEKYFTKNELTKYYVAYIEFEEIPLQRFLSGHAGDIPNCSSYATALSEIKNGKKTTHWIWYVFPQIKGRTIDDVTEYYALDGKKEAEMFLSHPVLGQRLIEITQALMSLDAYDLVSIFGMVDAFKLVACMTLFDSISENTTLFSDVLDKYFFGNRDSDTLRLI